MSRKLTARIQGKGSDGVTYDVLEYRDIIRIGTLNDPHATRDGIPGYELANGSKCNMLDDRRFQVVQTGLIITRTR